MSFDRTIRFPGAIASRQGVLPGVLADYFSQNSRTRGLGYFQQGRVIITRGTPNIVTARVRGTRPYNVSLKYDDGVLEVDCECEFFNSSGACKHLWATLLAADQQQFLAEAGADPNLEMQESLKRMLEDADALHELMSEQPTPVRAQKKPAESKRLNWKRQVSEIGRPAAGPYFRDHQPWPEKRHIRYMVDVAGSKAAGSLVLAIETQDRRQDGGFSKAVPLRMKRSQIAEIPRVEDREAIAALAGGKQRFAFGGDYGYDAIPDSLQLSEELARTVLPLVVATGQCYLRPARIPGQMPELTESTQPLIWDSAGAWRMALELKRIPKGWGVAGALRRGQEKMDLATPELIVSGGLVFLPDRVAPLDRGTAFDWLFWLRSHGMLEAPEQDRDELLSYLLCTPGVPAVEIPGDLAYTEVIGTPRPRLRFRGMNAPGAALGTGVSRIQAALSFQYDGRTFDERSGERAFFDPGPRALVRRDAEAETAAAATLRDVGVRNKGTSPGDSTWTWDVASGKLPGIVRTLTGAGWVVEAEGKTFRSASKFNLAVSSGLDWFDLQGGVQFGDSGDQTVALPALLSALRRGENMVRLGDGSYGLLPEDWLARIAMVAGMGDSEDDHVRFRRSQAGLLDALLASQPEAAFDAVFEAARDELRNFAGVAAMEQPGGFQGQLRDYQKEGLGWMEFLRRFSFGGCLADDMGTGKTAQVLAMLEMRREARADRATPMPSLIVVPRSLIFNWKEEAARFTPELRILDYTGPERDAALVPGHDVVLTTYGTLRRDITMLRETQFDYAVLDEAQMVKNSGTEGAKAVRLIRADHRLALSGTPVENHLGELWSMFEFLNPGILGSAGVFRNAGGLGRNPDEASRTLLAQALRPFILRRTKEQVARELPARTEQTIYCELEPAQRKLYDELRDHYRDSLLARIAVEGLGKSKIMVLEALLRLRQAACHPGLIDKKRVGESSAKLEALIEQLEEVLQSGHKALVFSQFTSLLAIVRKRLDAMGIVYEYLDGKTKDRQERVERFQNDPACPLFLISLKAGGLGLNLTAADYVFLLDPWWNPAVEAQAIDRAHRIGQLRRVSAYRLIARDTVEEKVLELQKTKRDLAAAIIGESNSVLRDLRKEDLELLLS